MAKEGLTSEQIAATLSPAQFAIYASDKKWKLAKHLALLNRKLVDVAAGRIERLLITMPPRAGKCLASNTKIIMKWGETKEIKDISVGDEVLCLDKNWKIITDKIISTINSGEKQLYKLTADNLSYLEASEDHKIRTFNGWKTIKELTTDDYVLSPNKLPISLEDYITEDDAILIACWLAEESKSNKSYVVTNESIEIINKLKEICQKRSWNFHSDKKNLCHILSKNYETKGDTPKNLLRKYKVLGMTTHTIRIPEEIYKSSINIISTFIGYLFATDGCVNTKSSKNLEYICVSEEFIKDLQRLLWKFNIRSMYRFKLVKLNGKEFPAWQLTVDSKESIISFGKYIKIPNKQAKLDYIVLEVTKRGKANSKRYTFPKEWRDRLKNKTCYFRVYHNIRIDKEGTTHRDKVAKCAELENNIELYNEATGDVDWLKVISIEKTTIEETYDIETENNHNFFGNNILTHNSEMVSKYFPAWYLCVKPDNRIILASYEQTFAASFGEAARDLVEEYGEELFGLKLGNRAASKWGIEGHSGMMYSVGALGSITGKGANCLVGSTLITTEIGPLRIEELCDLKCPPRVLSYNTKENKNEWKSIIAHRKEVANQPLLQIITVEGKSVICTKEHRFYLPKGWNGKQSSWLEAVFLCRGDVLLLENGNIEEIHIVRLIEESNIVVYDIQVEGNENFFSESLLTHNCLIIDDPTKNSEEAESILMQEKLHTWFGSTAYTRLQPGGSILLIQTRWSNFDLAGRILDTMQRGGDKWEVLNLPAIAEEDELPYPTGLGRKKGEALWPEMWPLDKLLRIKNSGAISSYYWAAMYQQRPVPAEGGHFKKEWFKYYSVSSNHLVVYPRAMDKESGCKYVDISTCWFFATVDTANKAKTTSDYTAIAVWGVTRENDLFLWDLIRDRLGYEQIVKEIESLPKKYDNLRYIGIENTGIAIQLITEMRNRGLPIRALETFGKGKENRANAPLGAVVRMESGRIWIPKDAPYLTDYELELLYFPKGQHDECVDVTTYAANELTKVDAYEGGDFVPYDIGTLKSMGLLKPSDHGNWTFNT